MPSAPAYTDTVISILTDRLGPNAVDLIAQARRQPEPGADPIRAALADHLNTTAHEASRLECVLRERIRRLHDFLARAQEDLSVLCTATRWEAVGISGTVTDQAAARFGDALERLDADAVLYAEATRHLPDPARLGELRALADAWRGAADEHGGHGAEHEAAAALAEAVHARTAPAARP